MKSRNLVCWTILLAGLASLVLYGNWAPIEFRRGDRTPWARFVKVLDVAKVPLASTVAQEVPPPRPPPPPPPMPPATRTDAESDVRVSACVKYADKIIPRLRRSIRVSAVPIDDVEQIARGASRIAAPPDVPAGFQWPQARGQPFMHVAQLQLADVAPLDEDSLLPKTGWLCFFYGVHFKPAVKGTSPSDREASQVVYFDGDPDALRRASPPQALPERYLPCYVRVWGEWNLPSLSEEPKLMGRQPDFFAYSDLCSGLTGRPQESGWHHLLGYAQDLYGPMRQVCELASQGRAATRDVDPNDPEMAELLSNQKDWLLLFQIDLGGLEQVDTPVQVKDQPVRYHFGGGDRLYYWIRAADLAARDFSRVWAVRQGSFDGDQPENASEGDSAED